MTLKKIIHSLEIVYSGSPWFGNNITEALNSITTANPNSAFNGSNSLGQILEHMIQWKLFVLEKLNGNKTFTIEMNSIQDWNKRKIYTEEEFTELIKNFNDISNDIINILKSKNDSLLQSFVPGEKYMFEEMLEGIIQHDLYHTGQLLILKKD